MLKEFHIRRLDLNTKQNNLGNFGIFEFNVENRWILKNLDFPNIISFQVTLMLNKFHMKGLDLNTKININIYIYIFDDFFYFLLYK